MLLNDTTATLSLSLPRAAESLNCSCCVWTRHLFVDASLAAGRSAALFSATLAPPSFYRSVLGCSDARAVALTVPSRLKIWGCIACRIFLPATATAKPACRQFRMHWPGWCRPERETTFAFFPQATHICGRYTKILQHVTRAFAPLCRKAV